MHQFEVTGKDVHMKQIARGNGWIINSDFGSSVREGSISGKAQGSGRTISFSFEEVDRTLNSVYVVIEPINGQTYDFWDNLWSNKIGGEPADQFALSGFVSLNGAGSFSVNLNDDSLSEGTETFSIKVYENNMDYAYGYSPLIKTEFKILDDDVNGTAADDILNGTDAPDFLRGLGGNDVLSAQSGNDVLSGQSGNDRLFGGGGNDRLIGGTGADSLYGGGGADQLTGNSGNDVLSGQSGNDRLFGGGGNDRITGGTGADNLYGGGGADQLKGNSGHDILAGQSGRDRLLGGGGNDTIWGGVGADTLIGEGGADRLGGGNENDTLFGGAGDDFLTGNRHHDALYGGQGNDTLIGGSGRDTLYGQLGNDHFVFGPNDGYDTVIGFSANDAEDIDLSGVSDIRNFRDLVNNHLENRGGDATIVHDGGAITLSGINVNEIGFNKSYSAEDFIF